MADELTTFLETNGISIPEWLRRFTQDNPDISFDVISCPAEMASKTGETSVPLQLGENDPLLVLFRRQGETHWIRGVPGLEGIDDLFGMTDLAKGRVLRCRASSRRRLQRCLQQHYSR